MIILWIVGIFLLDLLTAFTWTRCVKAVADNNPRSAALWGGAVYLSGALTILSYNKNPWLLIPAILGSTLGTYLSVKYK